MNLQERAIHNQIRAMGCTSFEVGIRNPEKGMLVRRWTPAQVVKSRQYLGSENAGGADIYIREVDSDESGLVLLDDIDEGTVEEMDSVGHGPGVTIETSTKNLQAWVKVPPCDRETRTAVARWLARTYGADMNSADWRHFGRLSGYTNRKLEHIGPRGFPFVTLRRRHGKPMEKGDEVIRLALAYRQTEQRQQSEIQCIVRERLAALPGFEIEAGELGRWYRETWDHLKSTFEAHPELDFDPSKADWAISVRLFQRGMSYAAVEQAITEHSPGLTIRKESSMADYVWRTAGKAEIWNELAAQGADWGEMKGDLLRLARERAEERARKI